MNAHLTASAQDVPASGPPTTRAERRPRILIALGADLPGDSASGPIVSIQAMREALGAQYDFTLLAPDRQFRKNAERLTTAIPARQDVPPTIRLNPGRLWPKDLASILAQGWDLIYLNSFFDRPFTLGPLVQARALIGEESKILIAPRGELSPGALRLKPTRKRAYLALLRRSGLLKNAWFHATSALERDEMVALMPEIATRVCVAANLRTLSPMPAHSAHRPDTSLTVAFLSRIDRKKNLTFAIRTLAMLKTPVTFNIYGPITELAYWQECAHAIAALPPHIRVARKGVVAAADVPSVLAQSDLFFLPTLSENFGHAIFDAFAAGTPVLISQATPWRDLASVQAGHDIDLALGERAFADRIEAFAAMSPQDHALWRAGARALAERHVASAHAKEATIAMFTRVLSPS